MLIFIQNIFLSFYAINVSFWEKSIIAVQYCSHCFYGYIVLSIHGSELGDAGMQILGRAINNHPGIVSLDVGDCKLGDMAVDVLYSLLLPLNNRPGNLVPIYEFDYWRNV